MIESSFEEVFPKEWVETQVTNSANELVILRQVIPWQAIITQLTQFYSSNSGRLGKSLRVMMALLIFSRLRSLSDDKVVEQVKEDRYMQYFCNVPDLDSTDFVNPGNKNYENTAYTWEVICPKFGHELANHNMHHKGAKDYEEAEYESDIPALRAKSKVSPCGTLWERILRRCENSSDIVSLSLAYLITGNVSFADRAKASIWKILEEPKEWDDPEFLSVNQRLIPVAIGYDWLYDYLTQEERGEIRRVAMKKGVEYTYNAARQHPWWSNWSRCNWGLVIYSAAGVASLAFLGEAEGTSEYVKFLSHKLEMWLAEGGENGGWGESLSYYQ